MASDRAKRKREAGINGAKLGSALDKELEQALRDFVQYKTVSSDRSLREDCYKGAKYLCKLLVEVLGDLQSAQSCLESTMQHTSLPIFSRSKGVV